MYCYIFPFCIGRNEILGDLLSLIGAAATSILVVSQEHLIKTGSVAEFLGMIGIFGVLVSSTQM